MARITCFTFPVTGHNAPLVPVVRELVTQGHEVRAAADDRFGGRYAATGAAVVTYPEREAKALAEPSENFLEVAGLLARLTERTLLAWAIDELRAHPADVVLVDSMAPWGRLAAERLGVPCVTSSSSFVITPRLGASRQAAGDVVARLPQGVAGLGEIARCRLALRHRFGVDCGGPMRLLSNRSATTIVHTSPEVHPPIGALAAQLRFVGATAAGPPNVREELDPALAGMLRDADGGARLAYVSLGTIYNRRTGLLRRAAEALTARGWRVVVSAGSPPLLRELGGLPEGALATVLPPQLPILDRAGLFITHGGLNSVHEALWRGVPMLLLPQAADQPVVAARVARLGAGRVLGGREPSQEAIGRAADELVASDAAARAAALGDALRRLGGAAEAAELTLAAADRR